MTTTQPITPPHRPTCATCGQRADAEEVVALLRDELTRMVRVFGCEDGDTGMQWLALRGARAAIEKATGDNGS